MSLLSFLKALAYFICHPYYVLDLTIVRRYADAQGHYIGELYEGVDRSSRMIGASCDNWPLNADVQPISGKPRICYKQSFLDPLPLNTLRVGAFEPKDNAKVQDYIAMRRFNTVKLTVHNRFCEYVLEGSAKPC